MEHSFFYLGLSLLSIHELDAVRCREWRIFPGLTLLSDKTGYIVFLFAHIPLFFWVFWQLSHASNPQSFIKAFDIFFIIHMGAHLLLLRHRNNEFRDWISWVIIAGTAVFGLADLLFA